MTKKQQKFITEDCERVFLEVSKKLENLAGSVLLITGGAGFMGSWISELVYHMNQSQKMDIRLFILDRDREFFASRQPHIAEASGVEFIRCDIRSLIDMPREVNYVIHAAATPDNRFHSSRPLETMTTIADGTGMVLRAANRVSNLLKFVNISSSSVYAQGQSNDKILETSIGLPLGLQMVNAYAEAKRYAEVLCSAARSEARIPVITLRPFTFCGAYQSLESPWALNSFINDALSKRPIRILGDGKTIRSFMYGADLAAWVLVMMIHAKSGHVFNLGSEIGLTIGEIAQKVSSCFQPAPNILLNTSLTGHVPNSTLVPDISMAIKEFGLKQFTDIDMSIYRTIQWYKMLLH